MTFPRLRRRRVFISYSREEAGRRDALADWLSRHGFEPDYDDAVTEPPGNILTVGIADKIRRSDCVVVLGTARSLASRWVESEVRYAERLPRRPCFLAVLAEDLPEAGIPGWFTMSEPLVGGVPYLKCFAGDFSALTAPIQQVRRGFRIRAGASVAIAFALLVLIPLLIYWSLRSIVDSAGEDVREVQRWVEEVNGDVENFPGTTRRLVRIPMKRGQVTELLYRDDATGVEIAHDTFHDSEFARRDYFRGGNHVARDQVVTHRAPNGETSKVKTRRIFPEGPAGPTVEDTFDSEGKLVSKRVRTSATAQWRYYAERGSTIYPIYPFLAAYR